MRRLRGQPPMQPAPTEAAAAREEPALGGAGAGTTAAAHSPGPPLATALDRARLGLRHVHVGDARGADGVARRPVAAALLAGRVAVLVAHAVLRSAQGGGRGAAGLDGWLAHVGGSMRAGG